MNITQEGLELQKIKDNNEKNTDEQIRGNIALKREELRDTIANGRRLDWWDQPTKADR